MEIIFEILFGVLQVIGELALQIVFEALGELGVRSVREPFRRPKPLHPVLAAIGYIIFGVIAGAISLWVFPESLIDTERLRILNLIVTPLIAGGAMAALGAWRRRRDQDLIRLDRFSYGFLFALAMGIVRFIWAD